MLLCAMVEWRGGEGGGVAQGLLDKDPRARLTAQEALEHCWFTGHGHNDAATLKHVHVRVAALASAFDLPVRCCLLLTFAAPRFAAVNLLGVRALLRGGASPRFWPLRPAP